jgi:integrase/recombinase XerD
MSTDICLAHLHHPDWLAEGPLAHLVTPFIEALRRQRYAERTVVGYVSSLAHFNFWLRGEGRDESSVSPVVVECFLRRHLPVCHCPVPCRSVGSDIPAALRHLLNLLPQERIAQATEDPITVELERFGAYLSNICGLVPGTRDCRVKHLRAFLGQVFGTQAPTTSQISGEQLEAFIAGLSSHLRPASLRGVCNSPAQLLSLPSPAWGADGDLVGGRAQDCKLGAYHLVQSTLGHGTGRFPGGV